MTIIATALQLTDIRIEVSWSTDEADPAAGFEVTRDVNPPGVPKAVGTVIGDSRLFVDQINAADALVFGDVLRYAVEDLDTTTAGTAPDITYVETEIGCVPGVVDPLASSIRYADLDVVKARLGIEDASWDVELTQAIIAGEVAIDYQLGRSLPDECITGIPQMVSQAAENVGVAIFKGTDSPFGVVGSDDYLGELDVTEVVRREVGRSPLLRGLRVSWGVA